MTSLKSDIVKRVKRLPKPTKASEAMIPLFEAISNSIHSTLSMYGDEVLKHGKIDVNIQLPHKDIPLKISVSDNGLGLDEKNYEAFITTDTDNKISIGGKGVGRLLWLDCFEKVHIHSFYKLNNEIYLREFDFCLSNTDQIKDMKQGKAEQSGQSGVIVAFEGLRDEKYKSHFPSNKKKALQYLASHFLPAFINQNSPQVTVTCGDEFREYPKDIENFIFRKQEEKKIETEDYGDMRLVMMECDKAASSDMSGNHFVHFIAHDRTVQSKKIDAKLGIKYFGENGDRTFHACLYGDYLNSNVNQERTNFTFEDSILDSIITKVCMPYIEDFLKDPLSEHKKEQQKVVAKIVLNYPSVSFGEISELQKHIPIGELVDDAIYGHLSRERFRRDSNQTKKIQHALAKMKEGDFDAETFNATILEASKFIEEAEQKSLAEYIVRRKVVLDFIEVLLQKFKDDEKDSSYQREDLLHSFICPMRINTATDKGRKVVPAASHDLWIIDERLTFSQYFSSDDTFNNLAETYNSEERPDLILFDRVHGLREKEQGSKVLLVEFKRPGRKQYDDDENPQHQIERYIKQLLSGEELDVKGRPIKLDPTTIFYSYIVADNVGKMLDWTFSWSATYDGRGRLYQPTGGFKGFIELITWDTLIQDAKERNKAFFDKAGIPTDNLFETE